jgi:hypothetical protein
MMTVIVVRIVLELFGLFLELISLTKLWTEVPGYARGHHCKDQGLLSAKNVKLGGHCLQVSLTL